MLSSYVFSICHFKAVQDVISSKTVRLCLHNAASAIRPLISSVLFSGDKNIGQELAKAGLVRYK